MRKVGQGGMGAVYEMVNPRLGRRLALKLLRAEHAASPDALRRFVAEARAVNLAAHPNIVEVLDFSRLPDGRHYLTMEFLEGESLAALLKRRTRLGTAEARELLVPICSALA